MGRRDLSSCSCLVTAIRVKRLEAGVAELVDASALEADGFESWGFKSLRPHRCTKAQIHKGTTMNALTNDSHIEELHAEQGTQKGERAFRVTVKSEVLVALYERQLAHKARHAAIKGFRPGKAPMEQVEKQWGASVRDDAIRTLLNDHVRLLVEKFSLDFIHSPQVDMEGSDTDTTIVFRVCFFIYPDIAEPSWKDMTIERAVYQVGEHDISQALKRMAEARRQFASSGKGAATGDRVVLDFDITVNGMAFEGGSAKQVTVTLGEAEPIKGLHGALNGVSKGAVLHLDAPLPDFFGAEMAGQKGRFAISVTDVLSAPPIIVNDATAQQWGCKDREDLKQRVKQSLEQEATRVAKQRAAAQLIEKLEAALDFPLSERIIEKEIRSVQKEEEQTQPISNEMKQQAASRLRLTMAVSQLAKKNDIVIEDTHIDQALRVEASRYGEQQEQVFKKLAKDDAIRQRMRYALLESQVCAWALDKVTITDVNRPFARLYDHQEAT